MRDKISKLDCSQPNFNAEYTDVLNWVHYEVDSQQLRRELISYAQGQGFDNASQALSNVHLSIESHIAYCVNHGAQLSGSSLQRLNTYLKTVCLAKPPEPEFEPIPETNRTRLVQSYVSCYSQIDNLKARVLANRVPLRQVSVETRKIVQTYAQNRSSILRLLLDHYRDCLSEASRADCTRSWVPVLNSVVTTLATLVGNRDSVRKGKRDSHTRLMNSTVASRDKKGEKAASQVSIKDLDTNLGIATVDPVNVVGSSAAVLYNTHSRDIEVLYAEQDKTLSVKGSKIVNWDTAKSQMKKLRTPGESIPIWSNASNIRRLEVLLSSIRGKSKPAKGKFNKNVLVLKVL